MSKNFEVRREVLLPGTPEQVFAAVTRETAAWMFPVEQDAGVGGLGPDDPKVEVWSPPEHVSIRVEGPEGFFNALDYLIEGRDGGTAQLRYVHSGVLATDDWEQQYDGIGAHTDFYLHSLGEYVRHFAGRPVRYLAVAGPAASARPGSIDVVKSALGLGPDSRVGDEVSVTVPGLDRIETVLDYLSPQFVGLRGDAELYRFYGRDAFGGTVDAAHHLFDEKADPAQETAAWQAWLDGVFAADATGPRPR
ncbi:MAG TPA: hypothetical protein VH372_01905 [Actinospica sp.]|jgi:hypothetical protein|nr:hypothetical protein [Actinospica sp.]